MLPACLSKIYLHPALHKFPIEMRELCEIPGNKCAFHPVYGNWVDSSTQAVFDGSMLPHADKKSVAPFE